MKIKLILHLLAGLAAVLSLTGCLAIAQDPLGVYGGVHHGRGNYNQGGGHGQGTSAGHYDAHGNWVPANPGYEHGHGGVSGGGSPMGWRPGHVPP